MLEDWVAHVFDHAFLTYIWPHHWFVGIIGCILLIGILANIASKFD